MIIGSRQRVINHDVSNLNTWVNNTQIKRVQHIGIGITIYENLTWKNHVDVICKKVSSGIGALKRVRRFMCRETAEKAYRGLILEPYCNYCCPVWDGIGSQLSSKLQKLQNRAARMIAECTYETSSSSPLEERHQ